MNAALPGRLRKVTSRQNTLVKELRQAFQHAELTPDGYCAIEGLRILEEAIRSGLRFKAVFFAESAEARIARLLPQISSHAETLLLPNDVFRSAAATESPQGVAGLVRLPDYSLDRILETPEPLTVIALGIQDPGNLGTVIRSAEAFAATAVLVGEGSVSQFNSKAVRASAGSIFREPVMKIEESDLATLKNRGLKFVGTSSHAGTDIDQADLTGALALFVGSEGAGLPKRYLGQMDLRVRIPHAAQVDSLNAGVAASIILYEAARQRRTS